MTGVVTAALGLIRAAKAGDVSSALAVELHTGGLDRDEVQSVLTLVFPFMCELYAAKQASERWMTALDERAFEQIVARLEMGEGGGVR